MRAIPILTATCAVLALSTGAGQTEEAPKSIDLESKAVAQTSVTVKARPETCRSVERAIKFYRSKVWYYQGQLGQKKLSTYYPERKPHACAYKRFVAQSWKGMAREYRVAWNEWKYQYAWWLWLPDKWQRIGACETGYGKRPGQWTWNSGIYQGAFGFYHGTWDQYKPAGAPSEAYLATPRQQYQAAENVKNAVGYGAWGCGGA